MVVTTGNINNVGQVLQILLNKKVLENFETNMYFYQYGEQPVWTDGYHTLAWTRVNRLTNLYSNSVLQEGVTPVATDTNNNTISITPTQYGLYVVISDMLLKQAPFDIVNRNSLEVSHNLSRIIDEAIQNTLWTTAPAANVWYVNATVLKTTGGARNSIVAKDVLTANMLAAVDSGLQAKAAPQLDGYYIGFLHTNVVYDLRTEATTGAFIDVNKYKRPEEILKGEVGTLGGIRVISSPFIRRTTNTGSVVVYPNYFIGAGAYGVGMLQAPQTYVTSNTATDSDPLAQRVKIGAKVAFGTLILQPDSLVIVETTSNVAFNSSFNTI